MTATRPKSSWCEPWRKLGPETASSGGIHSTVVECMEKHGTALAQRRESPQHSASLITVVMPVCSKDIALAVAHARWLVRLAGGVKWKHLALISHDPSCSIVMLNQFEQLVRECFERVETYVYPKPASNDYPAAANWCWAWNSLEMQKRGQPWFWMEADLVVLKRSWLDELQQEYDACGKPFMGPHVRGMQHANGSMIYPPSAPEVMKTAMQLVNQGAFDHHAAHEYMPHCHDCGHLVFHLWTLVGRMACPVGGGEVPANVTPEEVRQWLPASAVTVHRIKDDSLIRALVDGRYVHG